MTRSYGYLAVAVIALVSIGIGAFVWAGRGEASQYPTEIGNAAPEPAAGDYAGISAGYATAVEETRLCLEQAGLKDVAASADAAGKVSFAWGGFATREEAQRAGELYKDCYFKHMADADRLWQRSPENEAAATERGWQVMRCIEEGLPGFRFAGDEAGVVQQILGLQRAGDDVARRCMATAGTDMVKFTPLVR